MIFDLNDFDETLPGPFEWDVKRLVASFTVAGRHRGFTPPSECGADRRERPRVSTARDGRVRRQAGWTSGTPASRPSDILKRWGAAADPARLESFQRTLAKGRGRPAQRAVSRYTTAVTDGELRVISEPPFVEPISELSTEPPRPRCASWSSGSSADYRRIAGRRSVGAARRVPDRRHRAQGRGRRIGRDPMLDRPAGRDRRRGRRPGPPGQGGRPVRARVGGCRKPVPEPRPAGRRGTAPDAGGQRPAAGLGHGAGTGRRDP